MRGAELAVPRRGIDDATWRLVLIGVLLAATAARVALVLLTPHFSPAGDAADYQRHAASIAAGHGYPTSLLASPGSPSAFRPPGYPYLLGGYYALVGTGVTAGRLLSVVMGVLSVLLVAYLGRTWAGRSAGLLAAAIAAAFLPLIAVSASLLSEALFLVLELTLALTLTRVAREPARLRWLLLAGAICGLCALTRTVGIAFLIPTVVLALRGRGRSAGLRCALAVLGATALVLTPWTIRNADAFHAFIPISTQEGYTLAGEYNQISGRHDDFQAVWHSPLAVPSVTRSIAPLYARPGGVNEVTLSNRLRAAGLSYIGRHPGAVAAAVWLTSLRLFGLGLNHGFTTTVAYGELELPRPLWPLTTLSAQIVVVIALLGLLARGLRATDIRPGPWWLWALPLLAIAASVPFGGTPRYRAPLDPFVIILAAVTLRSAGLRLARRRGRPAQRAAAAEVSDASPVSV